MQAVQDAYKQGVNFFDIAPFYGAGSAERVRCSLRLPSTVLKTNVYSMHGYCRHMLSSWHSSCLCAAAGAVHCGPATGGPVHLHQGRCPRTLALVISQALVRRNIANMDGRRCMTGGQHPLPWA